MGSTVVGEGVGLQPNRRKASVRFPVFGPWCLLTAYYVLVPSGGPGGSLFSFPSGLCKRHYCSHLQMSKLKL